MARLRSGTSLSYSSRPGRQGLAPIREVAGRMALARQTARGRVYPLIKLRSHSRKAAIVLSTTRLITSPLWYSQCPLGSNAGASTRGAKTAAAVRPMDVVDAISSFTAAVANFHHSHGLRRQPLRSYDNCAQRPPPPPGQAAAEAYPSGAILRTLGASKGAAAEHEQVRLGTATARHRQIPLAKRGRGSASCCASGHRTGLAARLLLVFSVARLGQRAGVAALSDKRWGYAVPTLPPPCRRTRRARSRDCSSDTSRISLSS